MKAARGLQASIKALKTFRSTVNPQLKHTGMAELRGIRDTTPIAAPERSPEKRGSNDQPVSPPADPPMTTLEKIVAAMVVVGIIVFSSFQIAQCVAAYANPATQTTVQNVTRTFPSVMLCPFSYDQINTVGICPKWSPEASLSFDFTFAFERGKGLIQGCGRQPFANLYNNNVDAASKSQRSVRACPLNSLPRLSQEEIAAKVDIPNSLVFGAIDTNACINAFSKQVTVKNEPAPLRPQQNSEGFARCDTWTPPNVQCTVFDSSYFEEASRAIPGLNSVCNPMKEVYATSKDALNLKFEDNFGIDWKTSDEKGQFGAYTYTGLIQQQNSPNPNPFASAPSTKSMFTSDLKHQGPYDVSKYMDMSLFGGIVAVMYDASKGIPQALDFNSVRTNAMSNSVLGSLVVLSTNCKGKTVPTANTCIQYPTPAQSCTVTSQVDEYFVNAVSSLTQKKNSTRQTLSCQPSTIDQSMFNEEPPFDISISFSSAVSVITTPVISLSILTTISIIVSTAATLWGSQQKIKEGILMITAKMKEFRERSGAKQMPL